MNKIEFYLAQQIQEYADWSDEYKNGKLELINTMEWLDWIIDTINFLTYQVLMTGVDKQDDDAKLYDTCKEKLEEYLKARS